MTNRIDFKRVFLAAFTAMAVGLALVLVAGGSPASAEHIDGWPFSAEANKAPFWEQWGADNEGENDWVCTIDNTGSENAYVIGNPPDDSVWRLLVVKAGSGDGADGEFANELHWNPLSGDSFVHSVKGGWSHVILCSRPQPVVTTTQPVVTTTQPEVTTTQPEVITTVPAPTTTVTVLGTSIVTTTTVVVSPTDETLPFTGADSGPQAALALVLLAGGALALVGARSFRADTDE